ncbi:hypothetical protein P7K49_008953 [Saguinus oedipus]|uniref:Uncharacterized protein n=1 Tax=Saguinus oedipus TaxID=9490 RepID=A0ABQ9VZ88_SAGOE|nr:hypothetical protein P7K49_008953 [Saguinus oedipus]
MGNFSANSVYPTLARGWNFGPPCLHKLPKCQPLPKGLTSKCSIYGGQGLTGDCYEQNLKLFATHASYHPIRNPCKTNRTKDWCLESKADLYTGV